MAESVPGEQEVPADGDPGAGEADKPLVTFDGAWRDTAYGRIYRSWNEWAQAGMLFLCFAVSIGAGEVVARIAGGLSGAGQVAVHLPFIAIFFAGYALWGARLAAIASAGIGKALFRFLLGLILLRKVDKAAGEALLDPERWIEMGVKAQRAGNSFAWLAIPALPLAAVLGLLVDSEIGRMALAGLLALGTALWGLALGYLARRGRLPIMEPE